jgi:hypothetical protein
MTPGRLTALVIGVPVAVALIGLNGLSGLAPFAEGRYNVNYTAPADTKALVLNVNGNLTLAPAKAGQPLFSGTAHYSFVRATPSKSSVGGVTTIGYGCPLSFGDCELDGTVAVPASVTTLTSHAGSGNATVAGLTGPATLSTGSGDLTVSEMAGPLHLNTDSGSATVTGGTSQTIDASSGSGDVHANGVTATTINLNTDSGNVTGSVTVSATARTVVTASSGSGGINITFTGAPPRDVHVNTDSGPVTLTLPNDGVRYNVAANTDSGDVSGAVYQTRQPSSPYVISASSGSGSILLRYQ